jgi:hypothetical protein
MRAERQGKATRLSGAFRVQTIMLARDVRLEFTYSFPVYPPNRTVWFNPLAPRRLDSLIAAFSTVNNCEGINWPLHSPQEVR